MSTLILFKMLTAMACIALATAIIVRDPGFRPNRLMGAVIGCVGWWALCESLCAMAPSNESAAAIMRLTGLGWIPVSAFFFHTFAELRGNSRSSIHRLTPWLYGLSALFAVTYAFTPWGLISLEATPPTGWRLEYGWLFAPALAIAVVPAILVLVAWRASAPQNGSGGERRTTTVVVASLGAALVLAVVCDALLPLMDIYPPLMGSTALAVACGVIAVHLQRYGFSLLSADAFAEEIIGSLPDGVALVRRDGSIRYLNPHLAELADLAPAEAARRSVHDLIPRMTRSLDDVAPGTELVLRRGDGRDLPVVASPVAVVHERRGPVGYALIVRDRRDVAALRHRLVNSARLAAVGDLSAGIAREIMRPMLEVRGSLTDLKLHWQVLTLDVDKAGLGERAQDIVEEGDDLIGESLEGVDRVTALVRNVQGFSEPAQGERTVVDPNELVERAVRVALSGAAAGVELDLRLDRALPDVACRRGELEQVIVNLVVNAIHAVGEEGRVVVSSEARTGGAILRVHDDGCGIPAALRDRIFDPFFTTKPVGEGTGLGLAICYHIVRNHGGTINVESTPQAGTTFTIDLPGLMSADDEVGAYER